MPALISEAVQKGSAPTVDRVSNDHHHDNNQHNQTEAQTRLGPLLGGLPIVHRLSEAVATRVVLFVELFLHFGSEGDCQSNGNRMRQTRSL